MTTLAIATAPKAGNLEHSEGCNGRQASAWQFALLPISRMGATPCWRSRPDRDPVHRSVRVACGERSEDVAARMTLTVPRGIPRAWANLSDAPARMLAIFSPGGIEGFFHQLPAVDRDGIEAVAAAYGCRIVRAPLHT